MPRHELEWSSSDDLKAGEVEKSGEDTILAEIVDRDGSVVRRYEINTHAGER